MSNTPQQKPRSTRRLLILIGVLSVLLWIGREFVLGRTIWYLRAADVADMAIFSIMAVLTMIGWGIVLNGFPQPSEIFF